MAAKKILTLGKSLKENIDDAYEKFVTGGGKTGKNKKITIQKKDIDKKIAKQKQVSKRAENLAKKQKKTKKVTPTDTPVKELASKAKQKRNIKSKINEAAKKIKKVKKQQSTDLVPTGQSKTIKETVNPKKIKQNFKTVGSPVNKTPKINKPKKQSTALVTIPKNVTTNAGKLAYLKKHFGKNWKRYAAGLGLLTAGFLIPKDKNPSEGKIIGGGNKDKKPKKDFSPKIKTPKTPKVIKKELPKVKSNDYTGRFIDKKGNVAYDSASDFFAHMFGTPKKRKMPKKTARIIGTGDKLKRKDADKKGAGKGVKFKAFKSGTKDKTIGKPKSLKSVMNKKIKDAEKKDSTFGMLKTSVDYPKLFNRSQITKKSAGKTVGLKNLPPKAENPGIHMLPAKAKMNMGFKPMFGGGLIASFYDKPEKTEKYKGNTTSARQVKGYGKAKKKA
jgi:hypothetical protein